MVLTPDLSCGTKKIKKCGFDNIEKATLQWL
ncbi:hypothetical protein A3Q56_06426, partial [Intoshia linei]